MFLHIRCWEGGGREGFSEDFESVSSAHPLSLPLAPACSLSLPLPLPPCTCNSQYRMLFGGGGPPFWRVRTTGTEWRAGGWWEGGVWLPLPESHPWLSLRVFRESPSFSFSSHLLMLHPNFMSQARLPKNLTRFIRSDGMTHIQKERAGDIIDSVPAFDCEVLPGGSIPMQVKFVTRRPWSYIHLYDSMSEKQRF